MKKWKFLQKTFMGAAEAAKMVTKPDNARKTPPASRGTSPARANGKINNRTTPNAPSNKRGKSPARTPSIRNNRQSPDRRRKPTPERTVIKSRGNSPLKIREESLKSRGSENGSIERFDEDNNLQRIITSYSDAEDNINVVVRVRPLSKKEIKSGDDSVVQFPGNGQVLVDGIPGGPSGGQKPKLFSYNVVFEPAATQEDVLQFSGMKRLIEMAVEGFRCTCFCYGQTGSGKTHTLTGPPGLVIDLLNPGSARKPLAVRWSKKARGFFVENLFTVDCEEFDDLMAVLEEGMRNRSVGRHNMNDYSSRSHTILCVHITSEEPAEGGVFISRTGKINFVDLAGSEMTKKTQSEGKTLEEANNINKSLMVLGYCISSLSDSKKKPTHIPYRDSKLTKLLADSLAGNGVTLMIACISPARSNISETLNTLRYAARAKKIRTKPVVLMDPREALILSLKREVTVLQSENEHLRSALNVYSESTLGDSSDRRLILTPLQHVNLEELAQLEGPQLADLVRLYVKENEALRKDNEDMFASKELLQRDHEIVCRENERLLKKLEEVNSSPLIPARPAFSAEMLNTDADSSTNIWTNPIEDKAPENPKQVPDFIKKELDKRQIGGRKTPGRGPRRFNSLDDKSKVTKPVRLRNSESVDIPEYGHGVALRMIHQPQCHPKKEPPQRRFSIAQPVPENGETGQGDNNKKAEIFGSVISLTDEDDLN
ncbi:hypothetical protein NQ315_004163 [Exocentrus adspersus]|uniref:Kinesin-like protein n=1 Tax=Exocentrus adspersus TaxID=1586481 RepID=A0AAV8W8P2_9CUCU|nr:hypothetical protein NQ315_004163 [Exocentrus adspersus]